MNVKIFGGGHIINSLISIWSMCLVWEEGGWGNLNASLIWNYNWHHQIPFIWGQGKVEGQRHQTIMKRAQPPLAKAAESD